MTYGRVVAILGLAVGCVSSGFAQSLTSITLSPSTVVGGFQSKGTISLSAPAGQGGAAVSISSTNSAIVGPSTATVPVGKRSITFAIVTASVSVLSSVTVKATLGATSKSATLQVTPPKLSSVAFNPTSLTGGNNANGKVVLGGVAPTGGIAVTLTSTSSKWAGPKSVIVPAGSTSVTFLAATVPVSAKTVVNVAAAANGSTSRASLTLLPPALSAFSLKPVTVGGGAPCSGTVELSGPATASGIKVLLTSSSSVLSL